MIDEVTGEIVFESPSMEFKRGFLLSAFEDWPEFSAFECYLENGYFLRFRLRDVAIYGCRFAVQMMFFKRTLKEVGLYAIHPSDKDGWNGWSIENERKRHEEHLGLLQSWFPDQVGSNKGKVRFPWGVVSVVWDERSGFSEIQIGYAGVTDTESK